MGKNGTAPQNSFDLWLVDAGFGVRLDFDIDSNLWRPFVLN
jgi:hypothetical protein